jgi:hypothetical protein
MFYLDVVYVYNGFKCFSGVFASVSDVCFKCFICFQSYVAIVAHGFKSRSSVASHSLPFRCLTLVLGLGRWKQFPLEQARHGWAGAGRETGGSSEGVRKGG